MTSINPFIELKKEMDNLVVGHDDVKTALLLGVISREHIYIEGPPGTAKTMLAEIIAKSAHLNFFFYQLHRDTRLSELIGDLVISKEAAGNGGGELIRQSIVKGGILTAQICLLDDISRAPGESLNVLLRILNERKFGEERIPLLTAIATSNPTADEYYNEPLDPANLDRFVLQIKSHGLSYSKRWDEAKQVLKLYAEKPLETDIPARIEAEVFDEYYERLGTVKVPDEVQEGLLKFTSTLIEDFGLDESNSLISDRTFFVKSLKILKAHALLHNRTVCTLDDLKALKYMTAFRVPEEVFSQIDRILEETVDKKKTESEQRSEQQQEQSSEFNEDPSGGEMKQSSPEGEERDEPDEMEQARKTFFEALKELKENLADDSPQLKPEGDDPAESSPDGQPADDGRDDDVKPRTPRKVYGSKSKKPGEEDETWLGTGKKNTEVAENVKIIMKALEGHIQRNIALDAPHPGGLPRRWKRMHNFDELEDIDPFEAFFWAEHTTPTLPRVHKREREMLGGEIAILRDVSTSMMGVYSEWSSSVVKGVLEVARAKRMRVGYVEFNHKSYKYKRNGKFFTRDYEWISERASRTECSGNTNYEDALKDALNEFRGRGLRNKHILFITDGIPTSGDCEVVNERFRAKKLGVCIHSIFIGSKNFPRILEIISEETRGSQFIASRKKDGSIKIERKAKRLVLPPRINLSRPDPFEKVFTPRTIPS